MKYQPKVNQTQRYSDSQGDHIVCEGKLMLLEYSYETHPNKIGEICKFMYGLNIAQREDIGYNVIKPVIISETEKIIKDDKILLIDDDKSMSIETVIESELELVNNSNLYFKILALPEHFSDKHLQAIVDRKMKDGDEVLIKYDKGGYRSAGHMDSGSDPDPEGIHLDQQNHITLFPAEQSLEEVAKEYSKGFEDWNHMSSWKVAKIAFKAGAKWAKKNNY